VTIRASPPLGISDSTAQRFVIGPRGGALSITVVFYSDALGTLRVPGGSGSRFATVRRFDRIWLDDADRDVELVAAIPGNSFEITDSRWESITVGDGYVGLEVTAAELDTPPGAVIYRIIAADTIVREHEDAPTRVINQPQTVLDVIQTLDLDIDVIPGQGTHSAFGVRLGIPVNATVDVWAGIAATRPLPLAPKAMFVVSSSASDTFGVSGAQLVLVSFIDENGDWRNSDLLPMNGLTNVPITYKPTDGVLGNESEPPAGPTVPSGSSVVANIFRVQDVNVVLALGATEALPKVNNIGDIRVVGPAAVVFERIPPGAGRSRSAAFHCPRGYTARLTYAPLGVVRGQGAAYIAANFGLGTAWNVLPVAAVDGATALFDPDAATTPVSPRADVQGVMVAASNSIDASFILQFRLVPVTS